MIQGLHFEMFTVPSMESQLHNIFISSGKEKHQKVVLFSTFLFWFVFNFHQFSHFAKLKLFQIKWVHLDWMYFCQGHRPTPRGRCAVSMDRSSFGVPMRGPSGRTIKCYLPTVRRIYPINIFVTSSFFVLNQKSAISTFKQCSTEMSTCT